MISGCCASGLKSNPIWNLPLHHCPYSIYLRTDTRPDGSFQCPVSEFISSVYPHLNNRQQIALLSLKEQPTIPIALTEVPSLMQRDGASPKEHWHQLACKQDLKIWLGQQLNDTPEARLAWNNAEYRLTQRFRHDAESQYHVAGSNSTHYTSHAHVDRYEHEDDESDSECDEEEDSSDEEEDSSSDEDDDYNHYNRRQLHRHDTSKPRHTCGK